LGEVASHLKHFVGDAVLRTGDLHGAMLMGNLVHTSTTLLRRSLLQRIGAFPEQYRHAGEDYDFHLRTCREGLVGLLDLPTILYQIGLEDRVTRPGNNIHFARSYLQTLTTALDRDRARITLPKRMIRQALAAAHGWIGSAALDEGDRAEARSHLWQSLRYAPGAFRNYLLLAAAILPSGLVGGAKSLVRTLRGRHA
jgi:GT2 family glycosyltransferase